MLHQADRTLTHKGRAFCIYIEDAVPVVLGHVEQLYLAEQPGVVDEQIETIIPFSYFSVKGFDLGDIAEINAMDAVLATVGRNGLLRVVLRHHIYQNGDPATRGDKGRKDCSNRPTGAGDNAAPTLEVFFHRYVLLKSHTTVHNICLLALCK